MLESIDHSWALLYCNTFKPVIFVMVSEQAGTFRESIGTKYRIPEHHPLFFCKLLQYHYTITVSLYFIPNVTVL